MIGRSKVVMINRRGKSMRTMVYVVKGNHVVLIGKKDTKELEIIQFDKKAQSSVEVRRLETGKKKPVFVLDSG